MPGGAGERLEAQRVAECREAEGARQAEAGQDGEAAEWEAPESTRWNGRRREC